jgi:hypothetical protein
LNTPWRYSGSRRRGEHCELCRCQGKGLALHFKQAFPVNFKAYEAACRVREVVPGRMFIFDNGNPQSPRYILNFRRSVTGATICGSKISGPGWSRWLLTYGGWASPILKPRSIPASGIPNGVEFCRRVEQCRQQRPPCQPEKPESSQQKPWTPA